MRRYTTHFRSSGGLVDFLKLRDQMEQVLLRLHPRITYRMGQIYSKVGGEVLADIAVDGNRTLVEEAFKGKVWSQPVRFEKLTWGWTKENEDVRLLISANDPLESDPLAAAAPEAGEKEFLVNKRHLQWRYLGLMFSTLALLVFMGLSVLRPKIALIEVLYLVFFAIFLFTLNETPLDARIYAHKVAIKQGGMDVSFWMLKKRVHLAWEHILGLEYADPVCTLLTVRSKTRFLLSERFGCKDRDVILKSIVERAGLSFVERNFQKSVYRKLDAPL